MKSNINILIQLARIDGEVCEDEKKMIYNIGKAGGLTDHEISAAFENSEPIGDLSDLSDDKKFQYIYEIVELMMADERIFDEEIAFCSKLAFKLGYHESVLNELIIDINYREFGNYTIEKLKEKVQGFLRY